MRASGRQASGCQQLPRDAPGGQDATMSLEGQSPTPDTLAPDNLPSSLRKLPYAEVLLSAAAHELVGLVTPELIEVAHEGFLQRLRGCLVVGMRAAERLRDALVDHAELE